jgi:fatty acid desaturase
LIRWLFWNMPYHAEHHAYPAIPWHALPQLHALLAPELKQEQKGYLAFHRSVLGYFFAGKRSQVND